MGKRYALLTAEGGTDFYHAVTVHWSNSLLGPYVPQQLNPVLTHRHLGHHADVQSVGHADMVQTADGQWYAVCLGKRMIDGRYTFTRETFLCPVELQQGEFVFCPDSGVLPKTFTRPNLPWSPLAEGRQQWYYERIPRRQFLTREGDRFVLDLLPETLDSLTSPALVMRKVSDHRFSFSAKLDFLPRKANEEAGIVLHRNTTAYVALLKSKDNLNLVCCSEKGRQTVASVPYDDRQVFLRMAVDGIKATCYYGSDEQAMQALPPVSLVSLADDSKWNRFNGLGIGFYASSNGKKSRQQATFELTTPIDIITTDKKE